MKEVQDNIKIYYPDNETIDYEYDRPDDEPSGMLKQDYHLEMSYDLSHNIVSKNQIHQFGSVSTLGQSLPTNAPHAPTSYSLEYGDYAKGVYIADNQGYAQPHAPRVITEYPPDYSQNPDGMRVKKKIIDYDANGNQTEIREQVSDPEEPLGYREVAVRKNLWDEDDRLMGVDLAPENPRDKPLIAAYTYSADGERAVRYLPARLDAYYSAKDAGSTDRLKSILYPNSLITVKTLPLPEGLGMDEIERLTITKYTKHYYIGSERVASALGHTKHVGMLCEQSGFPEPDIITRMNEKVNFASEILETTYAAFDKDITLPQPFYYETRMILACDVSPIPDAYAPFWYHPDHLGSSSYITNLAGEINQHMEYLPFGELLVEEHLNSYNSPFKFNAKEFDAETGNYYYGARYYSPKYTLMLSVDPYANIYPASSPYSYVNQNPINAVDINGNYIIFIGGLRLWQGARDQAGHIYNGLGGKTGIYETDVFNNYWSTEEGKTNTFGRPANIAAYYQEKYSDDNIGFTSGSSYWNSQASGRMEEGRQKAKLFHKMVQDGTIVLADDETIKIISHSQGGAHAAGFAEELRKYINECNGQPYNIEVIEYITPHQPLDIMHPKGILGIQYSHENDQVSSRNYLPNGGTEFGKIPGILDANFHHGKIMGSPGQPPANLINWGGHRVTDNDKFIKKGEGGIHSPRHF